mmetsp:Transcript_57496/g.166979  ORF Transcript_57496/g.166979 Transcript_57496/m.166979 type:complete len:241 (-) Transcript_57496:998-1720(-)
MNPNVRSTLATSCLLTLRNERLETLAAPGETLAALACRRRHRDLGRHVRLGGRGRRCGGGGRRCGSTRRRARRGYVARGRRGRGRTRQDRIHTRRLQCRLAQDPLRALRQGGDQVGNSGIRAQSPRALGVLGHHGSHGHRRRASGRTIRDHAADLRSQVRAELPYATGRDLPGRPHAEGCSLAERRIALQPLRGANTLHQAGVEQPAKARPVIIAAYEPRIQQRRRRIRAILGPLLQQAR